MKRVPISFYKVQDSPRLYNTNNIHEYDPYDYDESTQTMFIDYYWFNSLSEYAKLQIKERFAMFASYVKIDATKSVKTPHTYHKCIAELILYRIYLDAHDFQQWFYAVDRFSLRDLQDVHIFELSLEEKRHLAKLTKKHIRDAKKLEPSDFEPIKGLLHKISILLVNNSKSYFLRLSGTSGKNEVAVEPVFCVDDVLKRLTNNILFLHQEFEREEKQTAIILRPWIDKIDKKSEFRVFVCNGKVTGVSQQHWQQLFCYTDEELDALERAIENATFLRSEIAPFCNFVADVWIEFDAAICHLIEYNPFGAHCGAGSSLFEWERDFETLYGKKESIAAELRYLSILIY